MSESNTHFTDFHNVSVQNFSLRNWDCSVDDVFTKQGENMVNLIDSVKLLYLIGHFSFWK